MSESRLTPERARLVEQVVDRVRPMARSLARTSSLPDDELESAGYEGLVNAALRFDETAGVPFAAYAHYRIRGAMIDAIRKNNPAVRRKTRAVRALEATTSLLEEASRAAPHRDRAETRTLQQRVEAAAEIVRQATMAVMLTRLPSADPDTLSDHESDPEQAYAAAEELARRTAAAEALQASVSALPGEERELLSALYFEGLSMDEYGTKIGRNKSTVSRRHARLLTQLAQNVRGRLGPEPRTPP